MGERVVRFAPYAGADLVDVCPLCQEEALESGWLKEGAPTTPLGTHLALGPDFCARGAVA